MIKFNYVPLFLPVNELDETALNILQKRYFKPGEDWPALVKRVCDAVVKEPEDYTDIHDMILYRYFVPNSPCLVNAGVPGGGLNACFVVDFKDSIEEIYKTKLDFALIAKKGGGCGTTLSKLRPKNAKVSGSVHGYAGGPIAFYNTICHDMEALTQAGFREMAMMGVLFVRHPDIKQFITAKEIEGTMHTTNISVMVDNEFMRAVEKGEKYWTYFDYPDHRQYYEELDAREIFNMLVEGAWRNGEPGILFFEKLNNSPYKYTGQVIEAVNPCAEQGLPPNGACNLGSHDISKYLIETENGWVLNLHLLDVATRLSVRFLDAVVDATGFPTKDVEAWVKRNRPVGIGIMGFADYLLKLGIPYGSPESLEHLEFILNFMYNSAEDESILLGQMYGVPEECQKLPIPRRNITLLSIAPTGTVSILAGCNSGIEPIFSEITIRQDKTGTYQFKHALADKDYFRCAVSANGATEVTWEEHIAIQNSAQRFVDAGVSKTINLPNSARKQTVYNAFLSAWKSPYIKGLTVYRNGSREKEVLSPKNLKKDDCPVCGADLIRESGCKHCSKCDFSVCEIG